jgi:succinyl-CoA synthetase beta subunit
MTEVDHIISSTLIQNRKTLSEWESARLLTGFGIPMAKGILAQNWDEVRKAAEGIGYPVVLKACSPEVSHKTESGLVAVDLRTEADLEAAFKQINAATIVVKDTAYLIQEMVKGGRELVMGMIRDSQFGPCVMFGLGGILTEILDDAVFRLAPLTGTDAMEMMQEIRSAKILGPFRGQPPADKAALSRILTALGAIAMQYETIREIDLNPIKIRPDGSPVAVDALISLTARDPLHR